MAGPLKAGNREFYDKIYYGKKKEHPVICPQSDLDESVSPDFFSLLHVKSGERFLDVACGTGWLLKSAEDAYVDCWGIDISFEALLRAREQCQAKLICCDASGGFLGIPADYFDLVTCHGSLEHIPSQGKVIREMARVCKPNGRIIIQVPNNDYILHKLGYETDWQPISGRFGLDGWIELFQSNDWLFKGF